MKNLAEYINEAKKDFPHVKFNCTFNEFIQTYQQGNYEKSKRFTNSLNTLKDMLSDKKVETTVTPYHMYIVFKDIILYPYIWGCRADFYFVLPEDLQEMLAHYANFQDAYQMVDIFIYTKDNKDWDEANSKDDMYDTFMQNIIKHKKEIDDTIEKSKKFGPMKNKWLAIKQKDDFWTHFRNTHKGQWGAVGDMF